MATDRRFNANVIGGVKPSSTCVYNYSLIWKKEEPHPSSLLLYWQQVQIGDIHPWRLIRCRVENKTKVFANLASCWDVTIKANSHQ